MWRLFFLLCAATGINRDDPAADQLVTFKKTNNGPIGILTTGAGAPINSVDARVTINRRLLNNEFLLDSLTHLARERIPERMNHAKGAGAFGYLEITHDISNICKAKLFDHVGKRTPVAVRFSPTSPGRGGSDTTRENRGFAVKFYTEEGNFDLVGLAFPMFAIRDPLLFASFTKMQKQNPATNLRDENMLWDFITLNPESMHMFMMAFSDRGIPNGYRYLPGFGVHTYHVVNKHGESFFVRFHLPPEAGIQTLSSKEARRIAGEDPDYATRDLYNAIENRNYPSWQLSVQVLTMADIKTAGFDVFDVTKILPEDKYPLQPIGRIVLNKNPINYHAEIEQLAFNPANLVPGILGAPDKIFEARRFSYRDAELYRLGANFHKITVNAPIHEAHTYKRDGVPPVKDNERDGPVYYPNSFNGPVEYIENNRVDLIEIIQNPLENNFDQMRELYVNGFTDGERRRLVENILYSLRPVAKFLKERTVKLFTFIHPDFGYRVKQGIATNSSMDMSYKFYED